MPDRWGRFNFDDGLNIARTFMTLQDFQGRQQDRAEKQKDRKDFQDAAGMSYGTYRGKIAGSDLAKLAEDRKIVEAKNKIGSMSDADVLSYEPKTYAEHVAVKNRIDNIRTNKANRAAIEEINKAKAGEAYKLSLEAFNEAAQKYQNGDFQGASKELANIGKITNNVFKYRPDPDGKTGELYMTIDGVDQPGQKLTIDQAMKVAQDHLSGEVFFIEHLKNREARRLLNEGSVLNPKIFTKGKRTLRAVRELSLNSNDVRWSLYDEKGNLYKRTDDIQELIREGWHRYDDKSAESVLKREKMEAEIGYKKKQTELLGKEDSGKLLKFNKAWWPESEDEYDETGNPKTWISEGRAVFARKFDTMKERSSQDLLVNQVLPEFRTWLDQQNGKVADPQTGQTRDLTQKDILNALDHIAYNAVQRQKTQTGGKKTSEKQASGSSQKTPAIAPRKSSSAKKKKSKPPKMAQTLDELDKMIPPAGMIGPYKKTYPWEGRAKSIGERIAAFTGQTQTTQRPDLLRKGEDEITAALRRVGIAKTLYDRNNIKMKLKLVYGKDGKGMTDQQIADAILKGELLSGNSEGVEG